MTRGRVLGAALALLGCGAAPRSSDGGACTPGFIAGTTDTPDGGFLPFEEGQPATMHAGPQGGYHLFVGVQTTGLPRDGGLTWTLHVDGGVELARRELDVARLRLEDLDCGWARPRDLLVFERTDEVPQYRGLTATLGLELRGARWSTSVVLR